MTDYQLADGVQLHIIKETKFKTVRFMVRFREAISQETVAKRVLISNMLETTNQVYTTGKAFSSKLSELFGASFATGVAKKGKQHLLSLNMNIVNPKFVQEDTLSQAIDFIKTALFQPDASADSFNPEIFKREQINLIHYLESMNDDRAYSASRRLAQLFFSNENQALPSTSTVELLKKETAQSVFHYFQKMLADNAIDIFVLGEVDETAILQQFSRFPFTDRTVDNDIIYTQPVREQVTTQVEQKEVAQSLLQMGFHLPIAYGDTDYLALQVMNGILGGFAHSKLFVNVREKASLAYSISSTFDSFAGFLKISAGIDAKNYSKAKKLIFEQLQAIRNGHISDEEINQTKTMLRNTYYMGQDSASNNIELEFIKTLLSEQYLTTEKFMTALEAVDKAALQRVASSLTYQAEYFMEGPALADIATADSPEETQN